MTVWRQLAFYVGFASLYAVSLVFSDFLIADDRFGIAPLWPPAGIGFACLLLGGIRAWPVIAIGHLAGQSMSVELPPTFLLFALAANILAPISAVTLVRLYWPDQFTRIELRNGVALLVAGSILAIVASLLGTAGATLAGLIQPRDMGAFGSEWFLGDLFGVVVCTPALLTVGFTLRKPQAVTADPAFHRPREKLLWLSLVLASAWLWLWLSQESPSYTLAVTFLPFAFLGWSALRFDYLFSTVAVAVITLTVAACIQQGVAGFIPPSTALDKSVLLFFLSFMAILPLAVGSAAHQNRYFEQKLRFRAHNDPLTRLPNRTAFEDAVFRTVAARAQGGQPAAVCYLDLDSFKVVNDTCGHMAGDELLKQIAHVLASNSRPDDVLARLGGDEFGFIFIGVDAEEASHLSNRLIRIIDQFRFVWRKNIFAFTASAGLSMIDTEADTADRVMSAADTACYDAKQKGGNRVSVSVGTPESGNRSEAMHWAMRITKALERNRFDLYCQPIMPLDGSGELPVHIEVLLRMSSEDGEILPPGMFIPAAESFNLMPRVDRWVVRHTLEFLKTHPRYLSLVGTCSVNLSGKTLGDPSFLEELTDLLASCGIPMDKVCFEITETAAIGDLSSATHFITTLRELGCRFALDDFGSGLSSFGYLRSLEVDYIKIDGVFIREMTDNRLDTAVVQAINDVGHVLGKKTVAEYVESEAVAQRLAEMGIDLAQGHAFGKPQPIGDFFKELVARLDADGGLAKQSV